MYKYAKNDLDGLLHQGKIVKISPKTELYFATHCRTAPSQINEAWHRGQVLLRGKNVIRNEEASNKKHKMTNPALPDTFIDLDN